MTAFLRGCLLKGNEFRLIDELYIARAFNWKDILENIKSLYKNMKIYFHK